MDPRRRGGPEPLPVGGRAAPARRSAHRRVSRGGRPRCRNWRVRRGRGDGERHGRHRHQRRPRLRGLPRPRRAVDDAIDAAGHRGAIQLPRSPEYQFGDARRTPLALDEPLALPRAPPAARGRRRAGLGVKDGHDVWKRNVAAVEALGRRHGAAGPGLPNDFDKRDTAAVCRRRRVGAAAPTLLAPSAAARTAAPSATPRRGARPVRRDLREGQARRRAEHAPDRRRPRAPPTSSTPSSDRVPLSPGNATPASAHVARMAFSSLANNGWQSASSTGRVMSHSRSRGRPPAALSHQNRL